MMRMFPTVLLTLLTVSGCAEWQTASTSDDRLKRPAAIHARALAGDDVELMRATGRDFLALTAAYFNWEGPQ
jgi:hypothetical protein